MQKATTLLAVIQRRGIERKPLERVYRHLYNPELYQMAYQKIYANDGAITQGKIGTETLDGFSAQRVEHIIQKLRSETYRWNPVRRTYIAKKNGKKRPLGIPSGNDKILQSAIALILSTYYEPQFSNKSHGFRTGRGCHTALRQIDESHRDVSWFIEGDIKGFFDNVDHDILISILSEKIRDGRFINLIRRLLQAGYMEDWKYHPTHSGTPQGGIISPLLANIYMNEFDQWIEGKLLPLYNRGRSSDRGRKRNPLYRNYEYKRGKAKKEGDMEAYKHYGKLMKSVPSVIDSDDYRKLEYVRYADDFLLSFAGPKQEAEEIKEHIRDYLERELMLELSEEKTLITHARSDKARFLGYDICVMQSSERRSVNGAIWYGVPREVINKAINKYTRNGRVIHRAERILNSDFDIIANFQAEYRGLVQYYIMAHNIHMLNKVEWKASTSLLKTLAAKYKSTVGKMVKKYKGQRTVDGKSYRVFMVTVEREGKKDLTACFGAIPLTRNPEPVEIKDNIPVYATNRSELISRMMANECEMCGKQGAVEIHHVRKLKDVNKPGEKNKPRWVHRMAAIRRKTLAVCKECHVAIHSGQHRKEWDLWKETLESRVR